MACLLQCIPRMTSHVAQLDLQLRRALALAVILETAEAGGGGRGDDGDQLLQPELHKMLLTVDSFSVGVLEGKSVRPAGAQGSGAYEYGLDSDDDDGGSASKVRPFSSVQLAWSKKEAKAMLDPDTFREWRKQRKVEAKQDSSGKSKKRRRRDDDEDDTVGGY